MITNFKPECWWCEKKLNKKARQYFKETNLPVCKKCDKILTEMISNAFR